MEATQFRKKVFIDTNIFVSAFIAGDTKNKDAIDIIEYLNSNYCLIYVSPMVLLELCVSLRANKISELDVKKSCDALINNPGIVVTNVDSSQILFVVNNLLNKGIDLRSNDLLISAVPILHDILFITFDKKIFQNLNGIYGKIACDFENVKKLIQ